MATFSAGDGLHRDAMSEWPALQVLKHEQEASERFCFRPGQKNSKMSKKRRKRRIAAQIVAKLKQAARGQIRMWRCPRQSLCGARPCFESGIAPVHAAGHANYGPFGFSECIAARLLALSVMYGACSECGLRMIESKRSPLCRTVFWSRCHRCVRTMDAAVA